MSEWFIEKKRDFYWWLEDASIPAKMGALLFLSVFLALLFFAPFVIIFGAAFIIICWLVFAFIESLA